MKNQLKYKTILIVTAFNILALLLIQPIVPGYFSMNSVMKTIYILFLFGFPLLIFVPITIFTAPFAYIVKSKSGFLSKWMGFSSSVFLVVGIFIFLVNSILLISKFGMGNDIFPLTKYNEIKGYNGDTSNLKTGNFHADFGTMSRTRNSQTQTDNYGETIELKITWISKNEYRLIFIGDNTLMDNIMDVKITNNTPEFYDCYARHGIYAQYHRIYKD